MIFCFFRALILVTFLVPSIAIALENDLQNQYIKYQKDCSSLQDNNGQDMLFMMENKEKSLSCYNLGIIHFKGQGFSKDYEKARHYFSKAASYNIPSAQYMYSIMNFSDKFGFQGDKYKASIMLKKAANQDYILAQYKLAKMTFYGNYFEKDEKLALEMLKKAAENGYAEAQNFLGEIYYKGTSEIKKDKELAVKWLGEAADQDFIKSQYYLGIMFMKGDVLKQNYQMAREWFLQAAKKGDVKSQYHLASLWQAGLGGDKNIEKAKYWYQKAFDKSYIPAIKKLANLGDKKAQYSLAMEYKSGESDFLEKDEKQSYLWVKKSAEQGYNLAQYQLGEMYFSGFGTPKNLEKASKWLKLAAQDGISLAEDLLWKLGQAKLDYDETQEKFSNKEKEENFKNDYSDIFKKAENGDIKAQFEVGKKYLKRYKENKKLGFVDAKKWLILSGEKGYLKAIELVGESYLKGDFEKDYNEAWWWYEKGANQGSVFSMNRLGFMAEKGLRKISENKNAIYWYKKGIEKNSPESCYRLGMFYYKKADKLDKSQKEEKLESYQKAYKWLKTAKISGVAQGQKQLDVLSSEISADVINKINKSIKRIVPVSEILQNDNMIKKLFLREGLKGDEKLLSELNFYYVLNLKCKFNSDVFKTPNSYVDKLDALAFKIGDKADDIQRKADAIAKKAICEGAFVKKADKIILKYLK